MRTSNPYSGYLFRTIVFVSTPNQWENLANLGVILLDKGPDSASVLVDSAQLESLSRLGLTPHETSALDELVTATSQEKTWLKTSLQPLLSQATRLNEMGTVASSDLRVSLDPATVEQAIDEFQESLNSLSPEQLAGIEALSTVDDDGDGLTNTEESWWCTGTLNQDTDGDGASDYVEVQAAKAWLANEVDGPPATGKPFSGWPPSITGCIDDDQDSVPDLAERWDLGLNMNRESTDRDKFDDGQELFGNTYCPGSGGYCGYGALPRNDDWGIIFAEMPAWVEAPGNHPLVAAFPVPEIDIVESSLRVEAVTTVTTDHTITQGTEKTYGTTEEKGTSTEVTDTKTWNNWQEVIKSTTTRLSSMPSEDIWDWLKKIQLFLILNILWLKL